VTPAVTAPGLPAGPGEHAPSLWNAIDGDFLALMSWDPARQVVTFPQGHPLVGWKACLVPPCRNWGRSSNGLCATCEQRRASTPGVSLADFIAMPKPVQRCIGVVPCAVGKCERPAKTTLARLCNAHDYQRAQVLSLPLEEFLAHPGVVPLPSFGPCMTAACTRDRSGKGPYCDQHAHRLKLARRKDPGLDVGAWQRMVPAVSEGSQVSLRGLPPLVVAEILYGIQQRTRSDIKTSHILLRPLCDMLRRAGVASVADLVLDKGRHHHTTALGNSFIKSARRHEMSPETERHKDTWDMFVFGHRGYLTFTGISQPWLREAVKRWAFDDVPKRRGDSATNVTQQKVHAVGRLSESLRLQRADHGNVIGAVSREDITAFCNRIAFLAGQEQVSAYLRVSVCRSARVVLDDCRKMGLTRPGQPLHGLPEDFALRSGDVPDEPEEDDAGKDLPAEVMRALTSHLGLLEASSGTDVRVAVELMMDTGRRPDEIASLMLDCLDADPDGQPVLIYDNIKAHRKGRRLPITGATAAIIGAQQERVRARFPGTPGSQLRLIPSQRRNPAGRRHMTDEWIAACHRAWADGLPDVTVPIAVDAGGRQVTRMLPFGKEKIICRAYRHTYAQRHADAGVDVTVLQELMDHRQVTTTQGYYRVGARRRREAVDRVTAMQFDRHGSRVWRRAGQLLATEHQRRAVGEVAVPYGGCSEPSNVAADGQDCPLRFRCVGCDHFHTDISYLPDLERYLADLLRHREKLRAVVDADEWARAEAMPSDAEVTRIRRLIERMKGDLDDLTGDQRAEIEAAVAVVRQGRARITSLGMPKIRQPLPDIRAERTA